MTAPSINASFAAALTQHIVTASRPHHPDAHLVADAYGAHLLLVNGSRLYHFHLPPELATEFRAALLDADTRVLQSLIAWHGLQAAPLIDDTPLAPPPIHALSLAIAQKCNLGCTYCYAQQGEFGGRAKTWS